MYTAAVADLRVYPFLGDALELVARRYGVGVEVLASRRGLVELGLERLRAAVKRGQVPEPRDRLEEEMVSFLFAGLLSLLSGSRWLVSRLALAEAERAYRRLLREPDEVVALVARGAGLRGLVQRPGLYREPVALVNGVIVYREFGFGLPVHDYVSAAARLLGDDAWRLSNLPVSRGTVYLDKERTARLAKEAIMAHVESYITGLGERVDAGLLGERLAWALEEVKKLEGARFRPSRSGRVELPKGVVVEEAFPPCMAWILERARRGEHLSHHERFAIATFLLNIGAEIDYVVDVFRNMPDFKEKITRYQVEHLAGLRGSGKKYRTYSCEKMKTLGLCKADCGSRSPVQEYYRRLRRIARGGGTAQPETSGESKEDARGPEEPRG